MIVHKDTLFLTFNETKKFCGVSEGYLWKALSKGWNCWQSIKDPEDQRKVLIAYEPLKDRYKEMIRAEFGDPYQWLIEKDLKSRQNAIEQLWIIDRKEKQQLRKIQKLTSSDVDNVALACAVARWYNGVKPSDAKSCGFSNKADLLQWLHQHKRIQQMPGFWVKNLNQFAKKMGAYKKDGYMAFVHGNINNHNAQYFDDTHQAICLELYLKPNKLNKNTCFLDYEYVCKHSLGVKPASYTTVKHYLAENDIQDLAYMIRHGRHAYETYVRPFVLSKEPEYSFSLIGSDGFWPSVSVRVPDNSIHIKHRGKVRTYCVWLNYDYKSKAILSWEVAPTETYDLFRLSMHRLLRLHGDRCPLSVILDKNMSQHKPTERLCDAMGMTIENKRPYNPKSNIAERGNKDFQKHFHEYYQYWVDTSFDMAHTINHQHNKEWIREAAKGDKVLEEAEFLEMINFLVNAYNEERPPKLRGKSRIEYCYEHINPAVNKVNVLHRVEAFGQVSRVTVKNNFYFKLQLHGKEYTYQIDWYRLSEKPQNTKRVRVRYDETNMEEVAVYKIRLEDTRAKSHDAGIEHDVWLCNCKQMSQASRAAVEHTLEDEHRLHQQYAVGAKHDKVMLDMKEDHDAIIERLGIREEIASATQNRKKESIGKSVMAAAYTREFEQSREQYAEENEYLVVDSAHYQEDRITQEEEEEEDYDNEYL